MLKHDQRYLRTTEGRKLYNIAKELIKGTDLEELIFPEPKTEEEKQRERELERLFKLYGQEDHKKRIEYFFNEVLPNTEL